MCCTLALKDWVIKYSWKPVRTGVLLNTFLKQMLSPPCWFIIQVEFGWRTSSRPGWTLLTLKTKKLTLGLIADSFCLLAVGNVKKTQKTPNWLAPPAAPAQSLNQTELSISSISFTIWYVVYCQVWNIAGSLPCMPALEDSFNAQRQCEVYRIITGV